MSEARPKLYLLDVEGTVAPISLVTEQLFPYARAHFPEFVTQHSSDEAVRADLILLAQENCAEVDSACPRICPPAPDRRPDAAEASAFRDAALAYLLWLMDRDRKSTALKSLQGKVWKAGFESGELKGTLFDDVPDALQRWSARARVAIYSSGSVEAQKLFFRHSIFGDLTGLISGYFDTRIGAKTEPGSYAGISTAMQVPPAEVLFFSDALRELNAARESGCGTRLVIRPGNVRVDDPHGHAVLESFQSL